MSKPSIIAFVVGTRPEAIKLAPVILLARRKTNNIRAAIVSTGQQRHLVGPAFSAFGLSPDHDLELMRQEQSLDDLMSACLRGLSRVFSDLTPDRVVVQGDTTSALAGAMAGFYQRIPVAHVEAGLRTHDLDAPFPEEANRQLMSRLVSLHFAPTLDAKANLLSEGIDPALIEVTGNTVVDALRLLAGQIRKTAPPLTVPPGRKTVLVTAHRRESLGRPLEGICAAVCRLAELHPELHFVFVTHPNPEAFRIASTCLHGRSGITLLPPLGYLELLRLVSTCWLILTDSGGIQEEAPSFLKPILVLRDRTERTEGISMGVARLVGTEPGRIIREVDRLVDSPEEYQRMIPASNPYGDGKAAERVLRAIGQPIEKCRLKQVA